MFANLSPSTIGIKDWDYKSLIKLSKKFGFKGIDLYNNFTSIEEAKLAGEVLIEVDLEWGLFQLPCDFLNVGEKEFSEGMKKLYSMLPFVKAAGCKRAYNHIWPGSDSKSYEENLDWHVNRLQELGALLNSFDVKLGLEFIGAKTLRDSFSYPFIYNLTKTLELIDLVKPNIGIVIDFFHFYTSGSTLEELVNIKDGNIIVNVHANDAYLGRSRDEQLDLERTMPLESGIVDGASILRTIRGLDYKGPVICEPFQPTINRLASLKDEEIGEEVGKVMKALFDKSFNL